jgi:hypothetical protein
MVSVRSPACTKRRFSRKGRPDTASLVDVPKPEALAKLVSDNALKGRPLILAALPRLFRWTGIPSYISRMTGLMPHLLSCSWMRW